MHEESHEDRSYEEENSRDYRQNRFGKAPSGRNSKLMDEDEYDVNNTYQDFGSDGDDNDQMESRADDYDSQEENDDLDQRHKHRGINQPVSSIVESIYLTFPLIQNGGARTHGAGQRSLQKKFSDRDINVNANNMTADYNELKKKKTLTQKLFGGVNKYLKN